MAVMFLFVDGIGLGNEGKYNPLIRTGWTAFDRLTDGQGLGLQSEAVRKDSLLFTPLDANLGVDGLPQSGTGQTALFSGGNAAKIAGRHYGPFPHSQTKFLLVKNSLFHKALNLGYRPDFVNAYPDSYLKRLRSSGRWNCTTLMNVSCGLELKGVESIQCEQAITAEITQEVWRDRLGISVDVITPESAADRLLSRAEAFDLILYEYYLTDKAGHHMDLEWSIEILSVLNRFVDHLIDSKGEDDYLVICSDHGNLEDLSIKTHTRNPVPLMIYGRGLNQVKGPTSILNVSNLILSLLKTKTDS